MSGKKIIKIVVSTVALSALTACGGGLGNIGSGNSSAGGGLLGGGGGVFGNKDKNRAAKERRASKVEEKSTIWDLFSNANDPNVTVKVNKYIWNAALDVLDFMPVEAADPFSGVIDFGYGTPPGSRRAYRATVVVRDPALDARSLSISMATRSGPASVDTVRAIEDAILTRARQLRIRDTKL